MKTLAHLILLLCPITTLLAQTDEATLRKMIYSKDSTFWKAYNECNIGTMQSFMAVDVEFYHDKGGVTLGAEKVMETTKKNLCGDNPTRLRREAVEGSVEVFPLAGDGVIYGAIISGKHVFYVLEPGKPERADGLAKFTHVWKLIGKDWKMYRILSYDHGPAPYINRKKAISLSDERLNLFAGTYVAPNVGEIKVQTAGAVLHLVVGGQTYTLYPLSDTAFFVKERDLEFEFGMEKGAVHKLTVKENGRTVAEAVRQKR